jgi:hypothetical protein
LFFVFSARHIKISNFLFPIISVKKYFMGQDSRKNQITLLVTVFLNRKIKKYNVSDPYTKGNTYDHKILKLNARIELGKKKEKGEKCPKVLLYY